ncbi:hypothetical protein [Brevibacillus centrosporus]|uniref:hypothetical protein n=1 Tax=Brevibacillus centrosporus TaxID=54910 RepID=UPI003821E41F
MLTDFQKSVLVDLYNTATQIGVKQRQLRDLQNAARGGTLLFLGTAGALSAILQSPQVDPGAVAAAEVLMTSFLMTLRTIFAQIQALREEIAGLRRELEFETDVLASTIPIPIPTPTPASA